MGIDVEAQIVVGLPMDTFKARDMPRYKEVCEDDGEEPDVADMIEDYAYGNSYVLLEHYDGEAMECLRPHEGSDPGKVIVGFPIAETRSWLPLEIGLGTLCEKHIDAAAAFYGLFEKVPKVYLVPRMW